MTSPGCQLRDRDAQRLAPRQRGLQTRDFAMSEKSIADMPLYKNLDRIARGSDREEETWAGLDVGPLQAPYEAGQEANQGFDFFAIELLQDVVPGVDHAGQ
jgi:hypothetical protein